MNRAQRYLGSTIGKKQVMAITGLGLVGFMVAHMLGHLQMFLGAEVYNQYSANLKALGPLLWVARLGLLGMAAAHIGLAISLARRNIDSSGGKYAVQANGGSNYASRTMRFTGPFLLLYVIYHLAHFTWLLTGPGYSDTDIYGNMVVSFQNPVLVVMYTAFVTALCFHLYHGVWSMLQSLGMNYPGIATLRTALAPAVAGFLLLGYLSVPVAILMGVIH